MSVDDWRHRLKAVVRALRGVEAPLGGRAAVRSVGSASTRAGEGCAAEAGGGVATEIWGSAPAQRGKGRVRFVLVSNPALTTGVGRGPVKPLTTGIAALLLQH